MQITTSKSSSASFETELCTCGDRKKAKGEGVGGMYSHPLLSLILRCVYVMAPFRGSHARSFKMLRVWLRLAMLIKMETSEAK